MAQEHPFPEEEGQGGRHRQAQTLEAAQEEQGREHHQVVPVEDPAGGAAAVAHHQPEGTPDQHADQVADVEKYGNEEQNRLAEQPPVPAKADDRQQGAPDRENQGGLPRFSFRMKERRASGSGVIFPGRNRRAKSLVEPRGTWLE